MYSRRPLRPITVIRAVHWAAIAVTGWSLSLPWGDELAVGKGPPSQWERHIVGAALLLLIAALAMSFTGKKDSKPTTRAILIAALGSLGAMALAMSIRQHSIADEQAHVLLGGGWMWMVAGTCMAVGAVASAATLRYLPSEAKKESPGKSVPTPGSTKPKASSKARSKAKRKKRK